MHLYVISTPIGNIEDITIRALKTLFSVDILLCEDTRRTGQLLKTVQERFSEFLDKTAQTPSLISYYDEIEQKRTPEIIDLLQKGSTVGLVSDNGTPLISDPGYVLVRECVKRSIPVTSIPGPNAALAALTSSGLPCDSFFFAGFLPEKEGQRIKRLEELASLPKTTIVCYCSPHKLLTTLSDMAEIFGSGHTITLAREITKIHEEIWTGTLTEALNRTPLGEYVLLWSSR